jgi:hypothetical protein
LCGIVGALKQLGGGSTDLSQVIVTRDKLSAKREASRSQESKISKEAMFGRWRRNDITGKDPVAAAVGYLSLPIVFVWAVLTGFIYLVLTILQFVFEGLGKVIGGSRSLITGTVVRKAPDDTVKAPQSPP